MQIINNNWHPKDQCNHILDFITCFRSPQGLCNSQGFFNSLMMASTRGPKHVGVIEQ